MKLLFIVKLHLFVINILLLTFCNVYVDCDDYHKKLINVTLSRMNLIEGTNTCCFLNTKAICYKKIMIDFILKYKDSQFLYVKSHLSEPQDLNHRNVYDLNIQGVTHSRR